MPDTDSAEREKIIAQCIEQLGETCKKVLMYYYFDELSMQDIADKLGFANTDTQVIPLHIVFESSVFAAGLQVKFSKAGHIGIDEAPGVAVPERIGQVDRQAEIPAALQEPVFGQRGQPTAALRATRPAGVEVAAYRALRPRRVEDRAREPRLPRRARSSLLLGAPPSRPRAGGAALHRGDRRGVPARPARRCACAQQRARPPHDDRSAHAEGASEAPRLDTVAAHPLGGEHRTRNGGPGGGDPRRSSAPRAGLSLVSRHPAPRQALRARATRRRVHARGRRPRALVSPCRLDPEARPRSRGTTGDRCAPHFAPARERARCRLLPTPPTERRRRAC